MRSDNNGNGNGSEGEIKLAPGEKLWPEKVVINNTEYDVDALAGLLEALAQWAYNTAEAKGFFEDDVQSDEMTLLNLMHTEVAEITNAIREGNPESEKIPGYSKVEEECGDVILRALVFAKHHGHDVSATIAKALYNETRPHRFGGKPF